MAAATCMPPLLAGLLPVASLIVGRLAAFQPFLRPVSHLKPAFSMPTPLQHQAIRCLHCPDVWLGFPSLPRPRSHPLSMRLHARNWLSCKPVLQRTHTASSSTSWSFAWSWRPTHTHTHTHTHTSRTRPYRAPGLISTLGPSATPFAPGPSPIRQRIHQRPSLPPRPHRSV